LSEAVGKDVYTIKGKYVGRVTDVSVDTEVKSVSGIEMKIRASKGLSGTETVLVPYDLIVAVDDIVLVGTKK
jgi:sporulation protein YlmC with PRC-barrel domain